MKSKIALILFFSLWSTMVVSGQEVQSDSIGNKWKPYLNLQKYVLPFWDIDTIVNESMLMIKNQDVVSAKLLYHPTKILSIKDATTDKEYFFGKDWIYRDRQIFLSTTSEIPYLDNEDLFFTSEKIGMSMRGKQEGTYVLFTEKDYFRSRQILVTYIVDRSILPIPLMPEVKKKQLSATRRKLYQKKPLKIVFYGNSITEGGNSSGFHNEKPYMPTWAELVIYRLRSTYHENIFFRNKAVGGKLAKWGVENVEERVNAENPDLVVIGFGMNDGSSKVAPDIFHSQIKSIILSIKKKNPKCEFIVVTPMLANPYAAQNQLQPSYRDVLNKLECSDVAIADMTAVHQELLKFKSYQDMTGNNVNHPNDYLSRWYAQIISSLLVN